MKIDKDIAIFENEIRSHRQTLHQIPEIGFEEIKTAAYIEDKLLSFGLEVETKIAQTGLVGYLKIDEKYPTIAFRSDMDALLIEEQTGRSFCSKHEGKMHACGHDGHMSILLIWAKYLCENKDTLNVNVLFVFQPAEEGPGGAEPMVNSGIFEKYNVKEIYGIHVWPDLESGLIGVRAGAMMAKPGEFDITITGKGGHGAQPHNSIDAIMIAGQLISLLQSIVARNTDPIESAVLTIGKIEGGSRRNIIAETVRIEGTTRAFDENIFNLVTDKMQKHCRAMEIAHDCKVELEMRPMYPPVVNDADMTKRFVKANKPYVVEIAPQMTAEDFAYYQKALSGLFFFVGTKDEEKNYVYPLHSSRFDMDEKVLLNGVQAYKNMMISNGYQKEKSN